MNKLVDDLVRERRGSPTGSQTKKDLLNAMLSGVDKQTGTQLDDLNIRYQINTFLIAGHETTSGLLSYTIYALLKNPDVLAKARAEVDRVFGNRRGADLRASDAASLHQSGLEGEPASLAAGAGDRALRFEGREHRRLSRSPRVGQSTC